MVIGGGPCSGTGAAAFNGSYVVTVKSGAFGHQAKFARVCFPAHAQFEVRPGGLPETSSVKPQGIAIDHCKDLHGRIPIGYPQRQQRLKATVA